MYKNRQLNHFKSWWCTILSRCYYICKWTKWIWKLVLFLQKARSKVRDKAVNSELICICKSTCFIITWKIYWSQQFLLSVFVWYKRDKWEFCNFGCSWLFDLKISQILLKSITHWNLHVNTSMSQHFFQTFS